MSGEDRPDRILIEGLTLQCIIGVNEWERVTPQQVIVDVVLLLDLRQAGGSDSIRDTVNYSTVTDRVREAVEESSFRLVEALAERVARVCLGEARVEQVEVRVRKPAALGSAMVTVEINRSR